MCFLPRYLFRNYFAWKLTLQLCPPRSHFYTSGRVLSGRLPLSTTSVNLSLWSRALSQTSYIVFWTLLLHTDVTSALTLPCDSAVSVPKLGHPSPTTDGQCVWLALSLAWQKAKSLAPWALCPCRPIKKMANFGRVLSCRPVQKIASKNEQTDEPWKTIMTRSHVIPHQLPLRKRNPLCFYRRVTWLGLFRDPLSLSRI